MNSADPGVDYQLARTQGDAVARCGLLDVAVRLLAEEGPQALTLRTLAQRANYSTKVVYALFGGKNGLSEGLKVEGFAQLRFTAEGKRLARLAVTDVLASLQLNPATTDKSTPPQGNET